MITADGLNKKIKDYLKSSDGEEKIQDEIKNNKALRAKISERKEEDYEDARYELESAISRNLPGSFTYSIKINDFFYEVSPPIIEEDGSARIEINFNKKAFRRKSLRPKKYPEGAEDIVGLFVHGWDIPKNHKIWGRWSPHSKPEGTSLYVQNKLHRDATDFIQKAVDEFMQGYAKDYGVTECIVNDYYKAE